MHRMPISCQRGRVLRRFRQNACRVDTQNAQKAFFPSTRPAFVAITPESLPRRHVECTEGLFSVNAAGFCGDYAGIIAASTRRTHRMPISCQRDRGLRRFRQNACHVDTQNAQKAFFPSTRPGFAPFSPKCLPRRHAECTKSLFSVNAAGFCGDYAGIIATSTRRMHRRPFFRQRGRLLWRLRRNHCRVDTQNAQNAFFPSTRQRHTEAY